MDALETTAYSANLIYSMLTLAQVFIFLTGFIILVNSLVDMARMTQEGSQITKIRIVLALVAATLMMNSGAALSVFGNTFFNKIGTEEVCFIVEEKGLDESCFSNELSGLTGALKDRVERISSDSTFKMIEEKIKIVIGIFQLIGFIYFGLGAKALYEVTKGGASFGYGKPITTMLASALIVDLPHSAQTFIDTLNKIGVQF